MASHVEEFNRLTKRMLAAYVNKTRKTKHEADADTSARRVNIALGADPMCVMVVVGPYLVKYGELIKAKKWDEFMKMDFRDEVKEADQAPLIDVLKQLFAASSAKEQAKLGECVADMLSEYCSYVMEVRAGTA